MPFLPLVHLGCPGVANRSVSVNIQHDSRVVPHLPQRRSSDGTRPGELVGVTLPPAAASCASTQVQLDPGLREDWHEPRQGFVS